MYKIIKLHSKTTTIGKLAKQLSALYRGFYIIVLVLIDELSIKGKSLLNKWFFLYLKGFFTC